MVTYNPTEITTPITIGKTPTILTIDPLAGPYYEDETFTVSGTLTDDAGNPLSGKTVYVFVVCYVATCALGTRPATTTVTNGSGAWSKDVTLPTLAPAVEPGEGYQVMAEFLEDATHLGSSVMSPRFDVLSAEIDTLLTINAPASVNVDEPFTVSGDLRRADTGELIGSGYTIHIYYNGILLGDAVTGVASDYSLPTQISQAGSFTLKAVFDGSVALKGSSVTKSIGVGIIAPNILALVLLVGMAFLLLRS